VEKGGGFQYPDGKRQVHFGFTNGLLALQTGRRKEVVAGIQAVSGDSYLGFTNGPLILQI
jgi:hypothetical protein